MQVSYSAILKYPSKFSKQISSLYLKIYFCIVLMGKNNLCCFFIQRDELYFAFFNLSINFNIEIMSFNMRLDPGFLGSRVLQFVQFLQKEEIFLNLSKMIFIHSNQCVPWPKFSILLTEHFSSL